MNELNQLINRVTPGNYFKYIGSLYQYRDHIGRVISAEELGGRESYELQMFDYNKQPTEVIRAYEEEIRDIQLLDTQLLEVGFTKESDVPVYHYQNLTVFYFSAIRRDEHGGGLTYVFPDYWATTEYQGVPSNNEEYDQLMERSVFIGRLHLFQNLMEHYFQIQNIQY